MEQTKLGSKYPLNIIELRSEMQLLIVRTDAHLNDDAIT